MPTISELNIAIGADITGLGRDLRAVERALRNTGANLANIGRNLTQAVTVPLVGIGAMSLKVAGEMESLRLAIYSTFEGAGRSMQEANVFLEQLRESAKAPGLDFPQAVQGAIRLMNTGMAAEKAKYTIEQLANAIATSGGTADDLNEVVNQFSQMIGKGNILNEDLKILTSRMPKLSQAMNEVFGTTNADKIRDMGVTAQEFVDKVTAKMAEFPRVQGGISNAFVNLTSSVKQFAAQIGDDLNKSLNLQSRVEAFSGWLEDLAASFRALSPETKEFIFNTIKWTAIAGPAIYALANLTKWAAATKLAVLNLRGGLLDLYKATISAGASLAGLFQTVNTRATFEAFSAQIAATTAKMKILRGVLIGGVIVGIVALGVALYNYSQSTSAAEKAALNLAEGQKAVQKEAAGEMAAVSQAIGVLKNDKAVKDERRAAIELLIQKHPEYLKGIDLEKASISQLDSIQKDLNESILRSIAYRMKANAVNAIYAKQAEKILRIQQLREGAAATSEEAGLIKTGDMISAWSIAVPVIQALEEQVKELGEEAKHTGQLFDKAFNLGDIQSDASGWYAQREKEEIALQSLGKKRVQLTEDQIKAAEKAAKAEKEWANEVALHNALGQFKDFDNTEYKAALEENLKAQLRWADATDKTVEGMDEILKRQKQMQVPGFVAEEINAVGVTIPEMPGAQPLSLGQNLANIQPAMPELDKIFEGWKSGISSFGDLYRSVMQEVQESGTKAQQAAMVASEIVSSAFNVAASTYAAELEQARAAMKTAKEAYAEAEAGSQAQKDAMEALAEASQKYSNAFGAAMRQMARTALDASADAIGGYIKEAVAAYMAKNIATFPPPFGIAIAAAAGAATASLMKMAIARITTPRLAKGGLAYGPTMAVVGDNPGASSNPEVIAPLDKLQRIMGGGSQPYIATIKADYDGLYLNLERTRQRRERSRGY